MSPGSVADDEPMGPWPEPPVTWPAPGSGFEADAFSPAGTAQREGLFFQGIARRRGGKTAIWMFLSLFILIPLVSLLVAYFSRR